MQTVTRKANDSFSYLAFKVNFNINHKIFGKKYENSSEGAENEEGSNNKNRDDEYYLRLDEENKKNNYFSNPDYSQRFSSRGSDK